MGREVQHTTDFDRIAALPRRTIDPKMALECAAILTPELRDSQRSTASLRDWQAFALVEVQANRGAFLAYPVGMGKTLICWLLPLLESSRRPMLIIPANLRKKTRADFASYIGQWRAPSPPPRIVTPTELAPESGEKLLNHHKPDLIIIDEADELANRDSSACRRIDRYIVANPSVIVVVMTGTPSRNSIMGYWHLLCWALRERAPVPMREAEALMWAAAIDEKKNRFGGRRPGPGPLGANVTEARAWYADRLAQTPGVVIVDGDSCDQPLTIRVRLAKEDAKIDGHYERFLMKNQTPGGMLVTDPLSRWRYDGQLGCGFYQYYDPPPSRDWRDARRESARLVREAIQASTSTSRPIDTEAQALRRFKDDPIVVAWQEIKPTYDTKKNTKVRWLSTATLESAAEWLAESDEPGIVWCGGTEFSWTLARLTGLSYYGPKGEDQHGRGLHVADKTKSMIASWHANKKGFNLQAWRRQLIVHPPQSGKWLEQIFGRSHRYLQDRPVVVDVLATSGGTLDGFESAVGEGRFVRETIKQTQKILRATIIRARPKVNTSNRFRWARARDKVAS